MQRAAELYAALAKHYQPATDHERALLEELAEAKWRCRTARTAEAALLDITIKELRKADPSLGEDPRSRSHIRRRNAAEAHAPDVAQITTAQRAAGKVREEVMAVRRDEERREREFEALRNRAECMEPWVSLSREITRTPGATSCRTNPIRRTNADESRPRSSSRLRRMAGGGA